MIKIHKKCTYKIFHFASLTDTPPEYETIEHQEKDNCYGNTKGQSKIGFFK